MPMIFYFFCDKKNISYITHDNVRASGSSTRHVSGGVRKVRATKSGADEDEERCRGCRIPMPACLSLLPRFVKFWSQFAPQFSQFAQNKGPLFFAIGPLEVSEMHPHQYIQAAGPNI